MSIPNHMLELQIQKNKKEDKFNALVEQLQSNTYPKKELELNSTEYSLTEFAIVIESLKNNTTIRELAIINGNYYGNICQLVRDLFKSNKSINKLSVQNSLAAGAQCAICEPIQQNQFIFLDMHEVPVDVNDVYPFATAFRTNRSLRKLDLRCQSYGNPGLIPMLNALQTHPGLEELNVNYIDHEAICALISKNSVLRKLYIGTAVGGVYNHKGILNALKSNKTLIEINYCKKDVSTPEVESIHLEIDQILRENKVGYNEKFYKPIARSAFLMGFHHRLGQDSSIRAVLSQMNRRDICTMIFDYAGISKRKAN